MLKSSANQKTTIPPKTQQPHVLTMSTEIDFDSLKCAKYEEELLVFGYLKSRFPQSKLTSSENIINYTIFAFYHNNSDFFSSFYDEQEYDLSLDQQTISGCGHGHYRINPNDTKYNKSMDDKN